MSTTEIVVQNQEVARFSNERINGLERIGNILAQSGYFSDMREAAQAAVKVMAGEELGIAPVAAVMGIHIIKGKITLSGGLIASQIRRHGYNFKHLKFDNKGCSLQFIGKQGEILGESSFTEEDAKTAGVYSDMYRKFPRNMYFNRAISNGQKWYCPEVTCGMPVYVPEELGGVVNSDGDYVPPEPTAEELAAARAAQLAVATEKLKDGVRSKSKLGSVMLRQWFSTLSPDESKLLDSEFMEKAYKYAKDRDKVLEASTVEELQEEQYEEVIEPMMIGDGEQGARDSCPVINGKQVAMLRTLQKQREIPEEKYRDILAFFGRKSTKNVTTDQMDALVRALENEAALGA
jgi:hypothetical protein